MPDCQFSLPLSGPKSIDLTSTGHYLSNIIGHGLQDINIVHIFVDLRPIRVMTTSVIGLYLATNGPLLKLHLPKVCPLVFIVLAIFLIDCIQIIHVPVFSLVHTHTDHPATSL